MKSTSGKKSPMRFGVLVLAGTVAALPLLHNATAYARAPSGPPALVITDAPLPSSIRSKIYNRPVRTPVIDPSDISGGSYFDSNVKTTLAGKKINDLNGELRSMQDSIARLSERLAAFEQEGRLYAADYYANIATIRTQLQSGTTPGNPRLVQRLTTTRGSLERLSNNIADLNELAVEISNVGSMASFLLESARAMYSLSGAIEEDHARLSQLEDGINNSVVIIDRLLNNVNDDITRTVAYVNTERDNLRTLSLGVTTGDLFGRSFSNKPFKMVQPAPSMARTSPMAAAPMSAQTAIAVGAVATPVPASMPAATPGAPATVRPLVKIRFDHPNVTYEQPLYVAVNEALERFPNARFDLVAIHPSQGNAAQISIQSTRSRRNAERVLRSLTQMGLTADQVTLSYAPSQKATSSEVHLYIR